MNIIDQIMQDLEEQRDQLIILVTGFKRNHVGTTETIPKWLDSMVFSEEDKLEQAIEGFCNIEDVIPINDIRDFQHDTVYKCIDEWESA